MGDEEKKNRWTESLAEAGLLDDIEDGWEIPGEVKSGATIEVDGTTGKFARITEPPEPDLKPVPFAVPYPSEAPLPPTPLEDEFPTKERLVEPSEAPTPIDRDYPGPFRRTSYPPIQDMSDPYTDSVPRFSPSLDPLEASSADEARSTKSFEDEHPKRKSISEIKVRGRLISVIPEPTPIEIDDGSEICDDPPMLGEPSGIMDNIASSRDQVDEMREQYEIHNFSGVLEIAKEVLKRDPNNEEVLRLKETSEGNLMKMYESRIGSFSRAPKMAITQDEVIWRNLDPASGFILSHIDGMLTFEDVVDISGMPRFETCRILNQLLQDGIIE